MSKVIIGLALGALLVGCSTLSERLASRANLFDDAAFAAPSVRVDAADVFAMSPAMQRFFEAEIVPMAPIARTATRARRGPVLVA